LNIATKILTGHISRISPYLTEYIFEAFYLGAVHLRKKRTVFTKSRF